jgi:hypothetical protein
MIRIVSKIGTSKVITFRWLDSWNTFIFLDNDYMYYAEAWKSFADAGLNHLEGIIHLRNLLCQNSSLENKCNQNSA